MTTKYVNIHIHQQYIVAHQWGWKLEVLYFVIHSRSASIPCTEFTESVCTHKFLHVINGDLTSCEILGLVFAKWVTWGKQLCSSFIDLCIGCRYTKFQVAPLFARTKAPMLVLLVLKKISICGTLAQWLYSRLNPFYLFIFYSHLPFSYIPYVMLYIKSFWLGNTTQDEVRDENSML